MKNKLLILAIVLCAGQVWAEDRYNVNRWHENYPPEFVRQEVLLRAECEALRELYPRPDPCPWTHMSVPEREVDKWYREGWEPFSLENRPTKINLISGIKFKTFIWLKKRICQEGK